MSGQRAPLWIALTIGAAIGVGYPFVDLALACRTADSEACVWGKTYFPLTLSLSTFVLGGVTTGLAYAVLTRRRGQKGGRG